MKKSFQFLFSILCVFLVLSSCGGVDSNFAGDAAATTPSTSPQGGSDRPPAAIQTDYNAATDFFVTLDANTTYPYYISQLNQYGTHCKVVSGTLAVQDLKCVIDAPELGIYFGGANLVFNVPPGMCEYARVTPYWYYNSEIGYGPRAVALETTTNAAGASSYRCSVEGSPLGGCGSYLEAYFKSSGGGAPVPTCTYDRSSVKDGVNCCLGTYAFTTTSITLDASGNVTASTSNTTPEVDWGGDGNIPSCIGGQGKTSWEITTDLGYPADLVIESRKGLSKKEFLLPAPIMTPKSGSNIAVANYYTRAEVDSISISDQHYHTGFGAVSATISSFPYYVDPISDRSGDLIVKGSPAYEFRCLDNANDVRQRIRLYIREWDANAPFLTYKSTGTLVTAKPWAIVPGFINGGIEATDCDGLSPERCNDFKSSDNLVYDLPSHIYNTVSGTESLRGSYFPRDKYQ